MSIKVMLADDHVLMREGIRQLLEFDGTISVIAEANNGVECMEQLLSVHPDILLLDINMPVMNGIEVLQEIKKKNISVKILVLTVHNEVEYLLKAVDIGVDAPQGGYPQQSQGYGAPGGSYGGAAPGGYPASDYGDFSEVGEDDGELPF